MTRPLAWGAKVSPAFRIEVYTVCAHLGWGDQHPNWLMACMAFESGESFSASIRNAAGSGAVGLIQFMPSTCCYLLGLKDTKENRAVAVKRFEGMAAEDQLLYVEQYFKPWSARVTTLPDMYMAILLPKYVGKPDDAVLFADGIAYRQNSGLDANKDGKVTKLEAAAKVQAKLEKGLRANYVY